MSPGHDPSHTCEIIAEVGVNHNGSVQTAKRLIDEVAAAGVGTVKFQTFRPEEVVTEGADKADYQERTDFESQRDMLADLTLSRAEHEELFDYCSRQGIEFLSTPYDAASVSLLESLPVQRYKVASADIVNKPLLRAVADTGKPVVLSTGMATLGEIERAVGLLEEAGCPDLTLLHCVSCYPAEAEQVNLCFRETLENAFDHPVGFSDHTLGVHVPVLAAGLGATVVEKHVTLDRSMEGPDHAASLEPDELSTMASQIRDAERALGTTTRALSPEELANREPMRRSLHARRDLAAGETVAEADLKVVRPATGIEPWAIDDVVGRTLSAAVEEDDPLTWATLR